MKVLVTGATGFIGAHVVENLLNREIQVIATSSNFERSKQFSWFNKVEYIQTDLSTLNFSNNYYQIFNKPDNVIHLAWEGLPNFKDSFHFENNLWRHYNFLKNLVEGGLKDLTVTGTCFEYGMKEGMLKEEDNVEPITSYGIAKNSLRQFLQQLQNHSDFSLKWIRLFYLYGNGQHPKSILPQLQKALDANEQEFSMSGGEQTRDYLPVEKVASNIVEVALQNRVIGIINCSSNNPISINNFIQEYLDGKGKSIKLIKGLYPYPDYEPMHFWGDNSKLLKLYDNKT